MKIEPKKESDFNEDYVGIGGCVMIILGIALVIILYFIGRHYGLG